MLGLRHARARPRMTSLHHHHRSLHRWPVAVVGGGPVGMMTSLLLSRFGVKSILLEASESGGGDTGSIRMHPRAHVMHPRAMEVLRQVGLEKEICEIMPPSEHWRRFRYCKSLTGDDYASVDHLRTKEYAMQLKISPCRAGQLSQPLLEKIVSNKTEQMAQQVGSEIHYGRRVKSLRKDHDTLGNSFVRLECGGNETVVADYVVACDGARSTLRNSLGVEMVGEHDMEAFASLHFRSKKLGKVMEEENKGAMLSFIFNDKVIGVVVSHDMRLGEWIIHVPFFPPIQTFDSICSDNTAIERVIRSFITGMPERPQHVDDPLEDLEIQSARAWGMHGICASRFSDEENRIFLVGDAAHQFPPSGGFGVNAGIVDAHNLAWKLAHVVLGRAGPELLETYDQERRPVIQDALSVAIDNYRRGLSPARALGLERSSMVTWVSLISSLNVGGASSLGEEVRRGLVDALFVGGKQHLAVFPANVFHQRVDEVVNKKQEALPLFFPRTDKGFVYSASRAVLSSPSSSSLSPSLGADVADPSEAFWLRPCFPRDHQTKWDASRVYTGMIFPHAWLSPHTSSPSLISTLDLIARSLPDWTIMCSSVHVAKQVLQQANKRSGIRIVALVSPDDENNGDDDDDLEVFKFVSKNVDLFQGTQVALVRPDAHVAWSGIVDSLSSALSHFHAHHIIQPLQ